ncbi:hypothetical protein GUITHDRAFT_113807 [Guillardia theta CCMP2712]|uniref:Amidase domain-containing protein n=1 Tax=Guillardia theta (strain CCMP2712) TaxID=905079 RepID=L1IV01_GUITC|nr:hypothetical protein GUITHDRAFT_113807 [Guillardia theta CCMP2712]EKX40068.1 hypothetical protein GUITHDRAFT_113807 [Guillardia theta CCMP2712]|eukprot:XP_005827048.1 hypothetical protein GUITHDRAFT_113807 [Guillardia theta CCMP2712]
MRLSTTSKTGKKRSRRSRRSRRSTRSTRSTRKRDKKSRDSAAAKAFSMVLMEAFVYGSSFALITWPMREGPAMKAIVISAACGLTYSLYRRVLINPNLARIEISKEGVYDVKDLVAPKCAGWKLVLFEKLLNVNESDALEQASQSKRRWEEGKSLGPLDGVPFAVKDNFNAVNYTTSYGTCFLADALGVQLQDCTPIARMKAAGAILVGKTGMHELGLGTLGTSSVAGPFRNPHNINAYCGGSSTEIGAAGSAAVVAAGLVPIALGGDGGGSVRIPASICGVYGLKPTHRRIPNISVGRKEESRASLTDSQGSGIVDNSVVCIGPIGATIYDIALAYLAVSGDDPTAGNSLITPKPHVSGFEKITNLRGVRIGIFKSFFEHADPPIVEVKDVVISNMDTIRLAHLLTIATETGQCIEMFEKNNRIEKSKTMGKFTLENEILLNVCKQCTAYDYIAAQKVKAFAVEQMRKMFEEVDVLALPTCAVTAPDMRAEAISHGELDMQVLGRLGRFSSLANFAGLPAISVPAGFDQQMKPIGFQLMANAYNEPLLLRLANSLKDSVKMRKPAGYFYGDEIIL